MAFYDKFPYTNFQELNLDWLTQEVSKVRDNRVATDASAAAALDSEKAAKASETAAAASQQAAANSETAAAGSEAASAEYLEQIGTHTAGAVADWLKDNLQPTTPPVDESLTVSGAAADAKVTGDKITDLKNAFKVTGDKITDLKNAFNDVVVSKATVNLFDKSNSNMILSNKSMLANGEIVSAEGEYCIRIPINTAGTYTYITQNTAHSGFIVRSTRMAGYDANGNVVAMYSNNTTGTASVSNTDITNGVCWLYIYAKYVSTIEQLEQLDIIVIKDWDGKIPSAFIPYLPTEYYLKSEKLDVPMPDTSSVITKFVSSNVFDPNNSDLIIPNSVLDPSGNLTQSDTYSVIKIPVNGIDGIAYNLYGLNSNRTSYTAKTTRWVMYDQNGQELGLIVNNTTTPAIVTSEDCKYLYCNCETEVISSGEVMVLTNAGGVYLAKYSYIPYLEKDIAKTQWDNKVFGLYGDSISAICNGNLKDNGWFRFVNYVHNFSRLYGRSIGGQRFAWGAGGGSVTFVSTKDGNYNSRNNSYTKDNYTGEVPDGCVKTRGAFCSWDRITNMFPLSIKDSIDVVYIMGGTNDANDNSALEWVANDTTDPEWAASDYYATYGGDYNISTLRGGIASTIMKMLAWMPNALIVLGTPMNGQTTESNYDGKGKRRPGYTPDEFAKSKIIKDVAAEFGIPCIDVYAECGVNVLNSPLYITDGTHPYSENGCKMLARAVISGLKIIYPTL